MLLGQWVLKNGKFNLGQMDLVIDGHRAIIAGTNDTLAGAVAHLLVNIRDLIQWNFHHEDHVSKMKKLLGYSSRN